MVTRSRPAAFLLVGVLGFACQLAVLHLLVDAGMAVSLSTAMAVITAVAHNFAWHRLWTWRERAGVTASTRTQFVRFVGLNGLVSLVGNVAVTSGLAASGVPPLLANGIAVVVCGVANFVLADRLVFAAASVVLLSSGVADGAVLDARTLAGWQEYVKATERRIATEEPDPHSGAPDADQLRRLRAGELWLSQRQTGAAEGASVADLAALAAG